MAGKITNFFRETQLAFSILITILGFIVLFIGFHSILPDDLKRFYINTLKLTPGFLEWSLYLLIIGFIVFIAGVWYLYSYYKNRKFVLDEIKTNKRSEFLKKHSELKIKAKHLPSKYQKMVEEKDLELNIK